MILSRYSDLSCAGKGVMSVTGENPHEILLSHLDFIRGRLLQLCRRHRASADSADELFGDIKVKLLENDCEVLRRFRGDAKLTTYLSVVIDRFFFDWTARQWGSWRSSASAREASARAQEVELLVGRDGFTRDEALRIAAEKHPVGSVTPSRLDAALPERRARWKPRLVGLEAAEGVASPAVPGGAEALCAAEGKRQLDAQLATALATLRAQDRLLVKLRYGHGLTVARIARMLGLHQRRVYGRVDKALAALRHQLETQGVGWNSVRDQLAQMEKLPDFPQENASLAPVEGVSEKGDKGAKGAPARDAAAPESRPGVPRRPSRRLFLIR